MALLSPVMAGFLGADGVWLSFPVSELICLLLVAGSVMARRKGLPFSLSDWMKLDASFGAAPDACVEFTLCSMEEVVNLSIAVIDFCQTHGIDYRRSMVAGLCVEEMAGNVIQHGFLPGEEHSVGVRVVVRDKLTIRVRDDCRAFDPQKRLKQFHPEEPWKNVGIRMIARMAEEMNYQRSTGINTLLIKV
jgi:anti-sigma regulatory factor (Ser/Thr protein kinase)